MMGRNGRIGTGSSAILGSTGPEDIFCRVFEDSASVVDPLGSVPLPTHHRKTSYSSMYGSFRIKSLPGSVLRMNLSRMGSLERDEATPSVSHTPSTPN